MNPGTYRDCRICGDKSEGAHFGVDSCRACAAFFRRSVAMNKTYTCRQSDGRCLIRKNIRSICRQCRFRKCIESGMLAESVLHKVNVSPVSEDANTKRNNDSPSENERVVIQNMYNSTPQPQITSEPSISLSTTERPSLLEKITHNYRHNCAVRRCTEISISRSSMKGVFSPDSNDSQLVAANHEMFTKIARLTVPLIVDFLNDSFETFTYLCPDDKCILFKSFVPHLWTLESSYYSAMRAKIPEKTNFVTFSTYIDTQNTSFFDNCNTIIDKGDMRKVLERGMEKNVRLVNTFRRLKLSETEFIAALSLLLWTPSLSNMDHERITSLAEAERAKIFNDLHLYYKQTVWSDAYAPRLGEIMGMFCELQWNVTYMREDMELFNLFDIFSDDTFLYDLVKM